MLTNRVFFGKLCNFFPLQKFSCAAPAKSSGYSRWLKFRIIFKSVRESTAFFRGRAGVEERREKAENSNLQPPFFFFLDSSKPRLSLALPPTSANLKTSASLAAGQGFKSKHYPPAIFQCCLSYPDPHFLSPSPRRPPFAISEIPVSAPGLLRSAATSSPGSPAPMRRGKPAGRGPSEGCGRARGRGRSRSGGRARRTFPRGCPVGWGGTATHHPLPAQCTRLSQRCSCRHKRGFCLRGFPIFLFSCEGSA